MKIGLGGIFSAETPSFCYILGCDDLNDPLEGAMSEAPTLPSYILPLN